MQFWCAKKPLCLYFKLRLLYVTRYQSIYFNYLFIFFFLFNYLIIKAGKACLKFGKPKRIYLTTRDEFTLHFII